MDKPLTRGGTKETTETLTPKEQKEVKIIEKVIENREISPADALRSASYRVHR